MRDRRRGRSEKGIPAPLRPGAALLSTISLPLRLRSLYYLVDDALDCLLAAGGLAALLVLPFHEKPLPLPERLAGGLVDHLDVERNLKLAPRAGLVLVRGTVPDWNISLVSLNRPPDDGIRPAFRRL